MANQVSLEFACAIVFVAFKQVVFAIVCWKVHMLNYQAIIMEFVEADNEKAQGFVRELSLHNLERSSVRTSRLDMT